MVFIVYGTTGELIKLIPLITELDKKKQCFTVAFVQQQKQLEKFFKAYPHIPKPDLWLVNGYKGEDLSKIHHLPVWLYKSLKEFKKHRGLIKLQFGEKNIVLVHGDTVTTVFGAYLARKLKLELGHIEAGLRSYKIMHPFPEELDRRIVSRYADVNFAPGDTPVQNLISAKAKGKIVNTKLNTVYDSIQFARKSKPAVTIDGLPTKYGIVSIHRNELLANKKVFIQTLKTLSEYAKSTPLVFLQHPVTFERIKSLGVEDLLHDNFIYVPKLDYFSFIKLLDGASFSVTDSGGLQEESAYINKPCLVHRKATERNEGIAEGIVVLSHYDDNVLRKFLDDPSVFTENAESSKHSPSKVIISYLKNSKYVN
jgi:UDP-N-acetylglucosamine 2-epimerase (non-hydrolysing)